jgi:hypothetical protein
LARAGLGRREGDWQKRGTQRAKIARTLGTDKLNPVKCRNVE